MKRLKHFLVSWGLFVGLWLILIGNEVAYHSDPSLWTILIPIGALVVLAYSHCNNNWWRQRVHAADVTLPIEVAPVEDAEFHTGLWCPTCAKPSAVSCDTAFYIAGTTTKFRDVHLHYCTDCGRDIEEDE